MRNITNEQLRYIAYRHLSMATDLMLRGHREDRLPTRWEDDEIDLHFRIYVNLMAQANK